MLKKSTFVFKRRGGLLQSIHHFAPIVSCPSPSFQPHCAKSLKLGASLLLQNANSTADSDDITFLDLGLEGVDDIVAVFADLLK